MLSAGRMEEKIRLRSFYSLRLDLLDMPWILVCQLPSQSRFSFDLFLENFVASLQ